MSDENGITARVNEVLRRMLNTAPDPKHIRSKKNARGKKIADLIIPEITKRCKTMPQHIKEDALQHAFLLFRSGEYVASDIGDCCRAAMNLAIRDFRGGHRANTTCSLDVMMTDDSTFKDLLRSDDPPMEDMFDAGEDS